MAEKCSAAGELWLDEELLCTMQSTSNLRQKIADVFELLRDPVYRYLIRVTGSREEAEDLTQETFLRLQSCLQKGQAVGNVRAWIFRVAHNLAIDQQRKGDVLDRFDSRAWGKHQDPVPDAEQRVIAAEQQ